MNNLESTVQMVKSYWQTMDRKKYKELVSAGELNSEATAYARMMIEEVKNLIPFLEPSVGGQAEMLAWERVRGDFLPY